MNVKPQSTVPYSVVKQFEEHLKEAGIKKVTIANAFCVSRAYVSMIFNGRDPMPDKFRILLNNYLGTNF